MKIVHIITGLEIKNIRYIKFVNMINQIIILLHSINKENIHY